MASSRLRVESWWAIHVAAGYDKPGTIVPFATGTFATYGRNYSPLVITASCLESTTATR